MNTLPIHPALVHLPLGLAFILPLVTVLVLASMLRARRFSVAGWALVVVLQGLLLAGGLAAQATGEREEDRVGTAASKVPIEQHERAAVQFLWIAGAALIPSVLTLLVPWPRTRATLAGASALAMVVVLGLAVRTGHAGGELVYVHGVIRPVTAPSAPTATRERPTKSAHDDD